MAAKVIGWRLEVEGWLEDSWRIVGEWLDRVG
jgi:hypothetical protein